MWEHLHGACRGQLIQVHTCVVHNIHLFFVVHDQWYQV